MLLVGVAAQFFFFIRVADEGGFHQHAGNVGGFEDRKTSPLNAGLVQLANAPDLAQQAVAQLQAVLDLRGGAHVEQGPSHLRILAAQIDAADQVGLVFFLCNPLGILAGGTALAECEDARALGSGGVKRVGVDADKQVGLHASGLLHPHMQGHKEVGIARQKRPHGVAAHAAGVDAVTQHLGDLEHHVFLSGAAGANRAGVFTAVARVQRNDDQPVGWARRSLRPWWVIGSVHGHHRWRLNVLPPGRRCGRGTGQGLPSNELAQRVVDRSARAGQSTGCGWRFGCHALLNQLLQWVDGFAGVQVQHQPVGIGGHRMKGEHLRGDGAFEVNDQAHGVRIELANPDAGDVGV